MLLTRTQILEADDIKIEIVPVPEWGGDVAVRGLSGVERDAFEETILSFDAKRKARMNLRNARAKLVAQSVVDPETKQLLFGEKDVAALGRKSAAALSRVYAVAQRLSGIGDEDVEELLKNSASGQSDDSGSDSP